MKICSTCRIPKDESLFHKNKNKKDGLQSQCKDCARLRDAKSYQANDRRKESIKSTRNFKREYNKALARRYKALCKCHICGEKEPVALDLHHTDPSQKDLNPASLYSYSTKRLKDEIRKCIVLCANCHRKVHAGIIKV